MEVFSYLDVEDILSLRRVSKLYYNLTHQGIIWKNFLKRIGPNAPQLPPSHSHSPQFLTSFEAERLVTRAISFHMNWMSPKPHPLSLNSFQVHRLVQSMVVLPGGKYMVASVCNTAKTHYSLVVFVLDHRIGGVVSLAETPVKQKAYNLQAKYMNIDGTPSIVIAYLRRKTSPQRNGPGVNSSIYNSIWENPRKPIDPPVPLQYVCTCLQISLDSLDALANPSLVPGSVEFFAFAASQPPPFRLISVLRSASELGVIDLAVIDGVPTLAVVKDFETIVFKELSGRGFLSTLCCAREVPYSSNPHSICTFRLLPHQGQVLVIRAVELPERPFVPRVGAPPVLTPELISLSMFSLPEPGDNEMESRLADQSTSFRADDVEGIQIADPSASESVRSIDNADRIEHPPLVIFYRSEGGTKLHELVIEPTLRGFLPKSQRVRGMCKFEISPDLRRSLRDRVKAMAWDEGNGRVFYVKPSDSQIHVVEFAKAPIQAPDGQRWPLPLADERMLDL
ncbi:hypothetical protein BU15DRAFT_40660 [Melanogaster broomeanus]|nr:hypothetical protein BU15DRAFT_40660 [Melanogaster broomeanus]